MKMNNERGVALVMTLFIVAVMLSFSSVVVLRTVNESNAAKKEVTAAKSFYLAEAGTKNALDGLNSMINTDMLNTVNATNPSTFANSAQGYVSAQDGVGFLIQYVKDTQGTPQLILNGTQAEYYGNITTVGTGSYVYNIYIIEKENPTTVTSDTWDFSYDYQIESTGDYGGITREVLLSGDFTVRVQKDNFAKYALFTNSQTMPGGTNVWFTDNTNFAGPIHTNGRFNIALNPSGTFEGLAEQHEQTARFYNSGWTILLDNDRNGNVDVPTFNAGFNRGVETITLSSGSQEQDMIDQAAASQTYGSNGIYIPNDGSNLTGGIYVKGDGYVDLQIDGNDNAVYKITQGGATKYITVDIDNNRTTILNPDSSVETYTGAPNGEDDIGTIIFIDGDIESLEGTVQKDTQLTIASSDNIIIQDNLTYSSYTAATGTPGGVGYVPPSAEETDNLLGIVSWNGDVLIGNSAPNDVNIHGTILASSGIFQVDDYNSYGLGPRGTATLLGGVITDNYGAFGLFSGATGQQLTGYGRNFVYDQRMQTGSAPPYFPSLSTFIAFTNDITDKMVWQEGGV